MTSWCDNEIDREVLESETDNMENKTPPVVAAHTKFRAPTYEYGLVSRDRLIDLLRGGRAKRLALIHAPAGFGKTTLAVQWQRVLQGEGVPVAWLSIDRDDNDAVWFLSHFIEAVRRVQPTLGGELIGVLEGLDAAQRYVLTELVNQIAELPGPLAIILDDWHLIEDPQTSAALEFLLEVAPDNLHLVITSRTRMPGIGKLKVDNQVTEIDATYLRFDQHESTSFLLELNSLTLKPAEVEQLWSTTDGWIAALQLASLSLRNAEDPAELIRGFSGRHHSIGDYLAENVLDALPEELLDFLLDTSICDRICGDLAAAVSGQPGGQLLLEELERRDMFLRPLDDNREWFRYHHLFAGYLRRRLERDHGERVAELHRIASEWFAERGLLSEAVTHALAAGADVAAIDLVERQAMNLVEHSRMTTLLGLVNKLPKAMLPGRPNLQVAIAWANCLLQRADPAQIALDHVRSALADATSGQEQGILGEADVVQACIDVYGDRIDRAADLVAPYLVAKPQARPFVVAVSANIATFVDIHTFEFDRALARQRWAQGFQDTSLGPFAAVYGRCFAGLAALAQADIDTAGRLFDAARDLAHEEAGRRSHAARLAAALLGRLHYERGDLDSAERLLEECHELGAESGVADFLIATYATLPRIETLRGDAEEAWSLLDEGRRVANQLRLPRLAAAVDHERVRLHLSMGDLRQARSVLESGREIEPPSATDGIVLAIRHHRLSMQARILCAEGELSAAQRLLDVVIGEASEAGWLFAECIARLHLASTLRRTGGLEVAARAAQPALALGAQRGLIRTVIDVGPDMIKLIADLRNAARSDRWPEGVDGLQVDYLSKLLTVAHADAEVAAVPVMSQQRQGHLIPEEALTAREVGILRLLDRGLSNKQIARDLGLTINTVKWYLKTIYTKLGVTRRGESVSEARRRNILP